MPDVDYSQLTALITTQGSSDDLERLLLSIRRFAPSLRVMAAVGPTAVGRADIECVAVPKKGGASAARNAMLARVKTPYFALLSDDLELHESSHLDRLFAATSENRYDLTAGELLRCERRWLLFSRRTPSPGHGVFVDEGGTLRVAGNVGPGIDGLCDCDFVPSFFVARTNKVRSMGGWEAQLTVGEREEFFVRARRYGVRVGLCAAATAWSWPRNGVAEHDTPIQRELVASKMGVERFIDLQGRVFEGAARAQAA